jgi:hypothetical protein
MNRNPFIDYPTLADYVFGANVGQTWFAPLSTTTFDTSKVVLYPNPSKNYISVSGISSDAKIEVYSILGKKVFEKNFTGDATLNFDLTSGIYLAKIKVDSKVVTKKLIIE